MPVAGVNALAAGNAAFFYTTFHILDGHHADGTYIDTCPAPDAL